MRSLCTHGDCVERKAANNWFKENEVFEVFGQVSLFASPFSPYDFLTSFHTHNNHNVNINNYNVQVVSAINALHTSEPPIAHRDLKPENVLLSAVTRKWKLCDFGSATTVTAQPTNDRERGLVEEDIERNTTMSFRAPEQVDLFSGKPIDHRVDIWALGAMLFKIVYGNTHSHTHIEIAAI